MSDLSESLWYRDEHGQWHLVWGAVTRGNFVLWRGPAAVGCAATDNMLRASLRSLKVTVLELESKNDEQKLPAAQRYSKCFQVEPVSGTWDNSKSKNAEQALYIAAVDAKSHCKWEGALQVSSQTNESECSQTRESKQENPRGDAGKERFVSTEKGHPVSSRSDENGAQPSSAKAQNVVTEQKTRSKQEAVPRGTSASSMQPDALNGMNQNAQKLTTVQLTGMDPEVAAVFVQSCPNLLTSVANVRQELYHQCRQPKGCDLMLSVQALKMLHSFVLSTDIESDRHNSGEGSQEPSGTATQPAVGSEHKMESQCAAKDSSNSKASQSGKANTSTTPGDTPNTCTAIAGAAKCLHNLDYDISHLLTKLSVLSTADMSTMARTKSAAMLLRDFCENTAIVGNVSEVNTAPIPQDDSMAGSSIIASSSGRSTMSGAVEGDTHLSRQENTTADSSGTTSDANSRLIASLSSSNTTVRRSEGGNDPGGDNGVRTLAGETTKIIDCSGLRTGSGPTVRVLGGARSQSGRSVLQAYERCDPGAVRSERDAENAYLSQLAKSDDTNRPLVDASRLPYMTYWMHARAI